MILAAMGLGALIGGVAGLAVYSVKTLLKRQPWNGRDALAHTVGGVVGGGLFAPVLAGLGALGLPTVAAYSLAGGLAWGGLWTLAQDAAAWSLGRRRGLGRPSRYLLATAIGAVVSLCLWPVAARSIGVRGLTAPAETPAALLTPPRPLAANLAKSEGEFLVYGAASEVAGAGVETASSGLRATLSASAPHVRDSAVGWLVPRGSGLGQAAEEELSPPDPAAQPEEPDPADPAASSSATAASAAPGSVGLVGALRR